MSSQLKLIFNGPLTDAILIKSKLAEISDLPIERNSDASGIIPAIVGGGNQYIELLVLEDEYTQSMLILNELGY